MQLKWLTWLILAVTFIVDCLVPLGFVAWTPYLLAILSTVAWSEGTRSVWLATWLAVILMIGKVLVNPHGMIVEGVVNRFLGIGILLMAGWICARQKTTLIDLLREIRERIRTQAELRESEDRLRILLDGVKDYAIVWLDPEGKVVSWTSGAERIVGYQATEIVGKDCSIFFTQEDKDRGKPEALVAKVKQSGRVEDFGWCLRKDGSQFWADMILTMLRDSEGRLLGIAKVTRDISEVKKYEDSLTAHAQMMKRQRRAAMNIAQDAEDARRKAQKAEAAMARSLEELGRSNAELEQFAYVASHDLRSPLRAVENLAQWIEEDAGNVLPPESRRHFQTLRQRIARMESLLEGLLEYSRVGRVRAAVAEQDCGALARDIVAMMDVPEGFSIEITKEMPTLPTAGVPLQQVLRNLVDNAIKHHDRPDGHITISARDNGKWVEFAVTDDGPGIAPEFHQRIFGIFQTLTPRDRSNGTGIGLALVKKQVESHGGSVSVASQGRGTRFTFTWPKYARSMKT